MREVTLSERERDVLLALGRGLSTKEVASELAITEGTVRTLLSRAYDALLVRDRSGALRRAKNLGLI